MVRRTLTLFVVIILCKCLFATNNPPGKKGGKANTIKTIIIDAGHGSKDIGAPGLFSHEADVALDIALKLGKSIQEEFPNIKVIYTRTTDELPGGVNDKSQALRIRADMANKAKGDLFISIHCNSAGRHAGGWYEKRVIGHKKKLMMVGRGKKRRKKWVNEPIYETYWKENTTVGTETYIWASDRSEKKMDNINQNEEYGEQVEDSLNILDLSSPEARLRAQLYEQYYFRKSALLAKFVEDGFKDSGRESHGVKQRNEKGIWVLQATGMPSVLIETGFISNKEEEKYLNSQKGQDEIVANILEAFRKYKQNIENPRNGNGTGGGNK